MPLDTSMEIFCAVFLIRCHMSINKDKNTPASTLKEGDKAPLFSGLDQNGKKLSLTDFKGSLVVLYFYPEDDTPTCTIQACNLRDNYALLRKEGFTVIGVSPDHERSHKKFEEKFSLPFILIADPDHRIIDK
jgi:peroxiredoxin Q/BCP